MSYVLAKDISQWQGNWQDTGEPIVMMKCGGGDNGLYFDSECTQNYSGAIAAGRAPGLYWFIGWTVGAEQEASFMLRAVSPLAEGDVYALDIEKGQVDVPENAVQYVTDMVNYVHDNTGAWPLLYMNLSTLNRFDWSPLLQNCGLWLADWAVSPADNIPTHYTYVMQQYSDGPNYDHDVFFGTVDQFKAYGYHAPKPPENLPVVIQEPPVNPPIVPSEPVEPPTAPSEPVTPSNPVVVSPIVEPPQIEPVVNTPVVVTTKQSWLKRLQDVFLSFIAWLIS